MSAATGHQNSTRSPSFVPDEHEEIIVIPIMRLEARSWMCVTDCHQNSDDYQRVSWCSNHSCTSAYTLQLATVLSRSASEANQHREHVHTTRSMYFAIGTKKPYLTRTGHENDPRGCAAGVWIRRTLASRAAFCCATLRLLRAVCMYICMYVSMYVCLPVCMYVCLYVCLYVFTCHVSVSCGAALHACVLHALGVHLLFFSGQGNAECMLAEKSTHSFP